MADVTFDWQRRERIGLAEAVLCAGKTAVQIGETIALARARRARAAPDPAGRRSCSRSWRRRSWQRSTTIRARGPRSCGTPPEPAGEPPVAVVTAGTSDLPVAREAIRTLAFYGVAAREIADVGVAGLWRILMHEEELRRYPVVIVVAGMEGALFSVVAGLVGGVVIAVPTSTGYGVARAGETALHAALASCAPGLVTVNIDNGYGAASAALRVLASHVRMPGAGAQPEPASA